MMNRDVSIDKTFEYLEQCIEILVLAEYGQLQVTCGGCNPTTQELMHCGYVYDEPSDQLQYVRLTDKEYTHCPMSYMNNVVREMREEYHYMKTMNTTYPPNTTPQMFWWFVKTYERIKAEIKEKLEKKKPK